MWRHGRDQSDGAAATQDPQTQREQEDPPPGAWAGEPTLPHTLTSDA